MALFHNLVLTNGWLSSLRSVPNFIKAGLTKQSIVPNFWEAFLGPIVGPGNLLINFQIWFCTIYFPFFISGNLDKNLTFLKICSHLWDSFSDHLGLLWSIFLPNMHSYTVEHRFISVYLLSMFQHGCSNPVLDSSENCFSLLNNLPNLDLNLGLSYY